MALTIRMKEEAMARSTYMQGRGNGPIKTCTEEAMALSRHARKRQWPYQDMHGRGNGPIKTCTEEAMALSRHARKRQWP